jgi:hypothetical protein
MTDKLFDEISQLARTEGASAALDKLIESQRAAKQYHRLFDALLMRKKHELGLPITRPTVFDDVPRELRKEFEEFYIDSAREVGRMLLEDGNIPQAWLYFRTIQEPEAVREAIEKLGKHAQQDPQYDEILQLALYEGANPLMGLRMMLESHGTCNTVTSLDQLLPQLNAEDRSGAAAILVEHLYGELRGSLEYVVKERMPMLPPNQSVRELIAGRDWLFEGGNYHIDVSHLNAVVRFARSLGTGNEHLAEAIELAEYGSKLDPQLQYSGDPPFTDFYTAHLHYLKVLSGENVEAGLAYFARELENEPDQPDKQLIAYAMVDLMIQTDRLDQAVELARQYLDSIEDPNGFSFADLCNRAGKMEILAEVALNNNDPLRYTAGLIGELQTATPA